jgi:hypothetical protein
MLDDDEEEEDDDDDDIECERSASLRNVVESVRGAQVCGMCSKAHRCMGQ